MPADARDFHVYGAEWTLVLVEFSVAGEHLELVGRSPSCPMRLTVGLYEFPDDSSSARLYPLQFVVD